MLNKIENEPGIIYLKNLIEYIDKIKIDSYSCSNPLKQDFIRKMLPYTIYENGKGGCILLNRDYKPLGEYSEALVKYEEYPNLFINDNRDVDYFYNDSTSPNLSKKFFEVYILNLKLFVNNYKEDYIKQALYKGELMNFVKNNKLKNNVTKKTIEKSLLEIKLKYSFKI